MKGDFQKNQEFTVFNTAEFRDGTTTQVFERFITDGIIWFLTEEASKYALFKNCRDPSIYVSRPFLIGEYNKHMGGTDLMDQAIATYQIYVRCKKKMEVANF